MLALGLGKLDPPFELLPLLGIEDDKVFALFTPSCNAVTTYYRCDQI